MLLLIWTRSFEKYWTIDQRVGEQLLDVGRESARRGKSTPIHNPTTHNDLVGPIDR